MAGAKDELLALDSELTQQATSDEEEERSPNSGKEPAAGGLGMASLKHSLPEPPAAAGAAHTADAADAAPAQGDLHSQEVSNAFEGLNHMLDNRADPTEIAGMVKQIMASNAQRS